MATNGNGKPDLSWLAKAIVMWVCKVFGSTPL